MKFTGLIATVAMIGAVSAQTNSTMNTTVTTNTTSFDLANMNGTWNIAGFTNAMVSHVTSLAKKYNVSVSCPEVFISGFAPNVTFIQPSLQVEWVNTTTNETQKQNISFSGLASLESIDSPKEATFNFSVSVPSMNSSNPLPLLTTGFSAGNGSNPLPEGADFFGNMKVKFGSSDNATADDVLFITAYNFTNAHAGLANHTKSAKHSGNETYHAVLIHDNSTIDEATFKTVASEGFGTNATTLTRLNDTCSA